MEDPIKQSKETYEKNLEKEPDSEQKKAILEKILGSSEIPLPSQETKTEGKETTEQEEYDEEDEEELDKMRKQLLFLAMSKPQILDKDVNLDIINRINEMSMDELKMRLVYAKQLQMKQLGSRINEQAIKIVNGLVGNIFGCAEFLNEQTLADDILLESTSEVFSEHIPFIPAHMKAIGLYGIHLSTAMGRSFNKKMDEKKQLLNNSNIPIPDEKKPLNLE